jgi:hypothetical protein
MQKITIGIQPLAELRAEMLAVARGERKADPDAPRVRFESLRALAKALQTDVATVKRVLLPAASSPASWWADVPRRASRIRGAEKSSSVRVSKTTEMRTDKRKFKSGAFEAIHQSAAALHKVGAIDNAAMREFDAMTVLPQYAPDDGRLSAVQVRQIKAAVSQPAAPRSRRSTLFGTK